MFVAPFHFILCMYVCCTYCVFYVIFTNCNTLFVSVFHIINNKHKHKHISSILYCIFILCIIVINLALWLQYLNKLTYLLTRNLCHEISTILAVISNLTLSDWTIDSCKK